MPFTVVTLKNAPPSLRGDLSKWMQEIAVGVYVGNFSTRIRERLWDRISENLGNGEATLCYSFRNEIGYAFKTINTKREVIDLDGLPLVFLPNPELNKKSVEINDGFSNAAKFKKQKNFSLKNTIKESSKISFVVIDIETTGLNKDKDKIIEIGAVKFSEGEKSEFERLIKIAENLETFISRLTGLTDDDLKIKGIELDLALKQLKEFIGENIVVGYNVRFDVDFINRNLEKINEQPLNNKVIDLVQLVKHENMFLTNYKLETVIEKYGIEGKLRHRALSDAKQTMELAFKLNKFYNKLTQ